MCGQFDFDSTRLCLLPVTIRRASTEDMIQSRLFDLSLSAPVKGDVDSAVSEIRSSVFGLQAAIGATLVVHYIL